MLRGETVAAPYPGGMSPAAPSSGSPTTGRDRLLQACIEWFAANGIGDASLRQVAAAVGSSHRMLIYHFGSREGLLEAVVDELERNERAILAEVMGRDDQPMRERTWSFWTHVVDVVDFYGPLYFELASRAMRSEDPASPLRIPNVEMWTQAMADMWKQAGLKPAQARIHGRLNLAVARGLLHDFLLTRDRKAVDQAMAMYDWLSFGEPSPVGRVRRMSRSWVVPTTGE